MADATALSDERFCELWQLARDGTPEGMCGHVQVRQFGKLLFAELGITSHGPWPLGWVPSETVQFQRRNGYRKDARTWVWGDWRACTEKDAMRVDGLRSWQWRKIISPAAGRSLDGVTHDAFPEVTSG